MDARQRRASPGYAEEKSPSRNTSPAPPSHESKRHPNPPAPRQRLVHLVHNRAAGGADTPVLRVVKHRLQRTKVARLWNAVVVEEEDIFPALTSTPTFRCRVSPAGLRTYVSKYGRFRPLANIRTARSVPSSSDPSTTTTSPGAPSNPARSERSASTRSGRCRVARTRLHAGRVRSPARPSATR